MSIYEHIDKLKQLKTNFKQEFLRKGVDLSQEEFSNYYKHISSLGNSLQLYPVNLYREYTNLIIEDNNNGLFATCYEIYDNGVKIDEIKNKSYSIQNLSCGEHNFYVIAKGENFIASENSNPYYYPVFSYTKSYTGIISSYNFNVGTYQTVTDYLSVTDGGYLPREVTVLVGGEVGEYVYNCYTGELIISNVTGEVEVIAKSDIYPILSCPILSVNDWNIWWEAVENASLYRIYANGEIALETESTYVDLRTCLNLGQTYEIKVSCIAENYQESALSEGVVVEVQNYAPVYGVTGLDDLTTTNLTRTFDAQVLNYYYNSSSGEIISDFDNVFPFNEMVVVEINGNKMVKIPKMYFRIDLAENQDVISGVAVSKEPRDIGDWYQSDEFYVGAYLNSLVNNVAYSKTNSLINRTFGVANGRTAVKANGDYFDLIKPKHYYTIYLLTLIEYATKNPSYFITKDSSTITGSTDTILNDSGYNLESGTFKYHNIEDFIGGNKIYVFGLISDCGNIKYRTSTGVYNSLNNEYLDVDKLWISGIKWIKEHPFIILPCKFSEQKENTFYSKCTIDVSGNYNFVHGGRCSDNAGLLETKVILNTNPSREIATRMIWEEI